MIYLYYGNQLVQEFKDLYEYFMKFGKNAPTDNNEIYNGGYFYDSRDREWYRCDLSPVLLADLPKELQLIALLTH